MGHFLPNDLISFVKKEVGSSPARGWASEGLGVLGKSYQLPRGTENAAIWIDLRKDQAVNACMLGMELAGRYGLGLSKLTS